MAVTVDVPFTPRLPRFVRDRLPQIRAACEQFPRGPAVAVRVGCQPRLSAPNIRLGFHGRVRAGSGHGLRRTFRTLPVRTPNPSRGRRIRSTTVRSGPPSETFSTGGSPKTEGRAQVDIGSYKFIDNKYFQASVDATKVELYARP